MFGKVSTGELDRAIDMFLPRLRQMIIDWKGKILTFIVKRIFENYNSSSENISKILCIYHYIILRSLEISGFFGKRLQNFEYLFD